MLKLIKRNKKQPEQSLNGIKNEQDNSKSGQIVKTEHIEGTPFTIVTVEDDKHFLAIGNNRITEVTPYRQQLREKVIRKDWELIVGLITVIQEKLQLKK